MNQIAKLKSKSHTSSEDQGAQVVTLAPMGQIFVSTMAIGGGSYCPFRTVILMDAVLRSGDYYSSH